MQQLTRYFSALIKQNTNLREKMFKPCWSHRIFRAKKSSACLPSEGK